jgi:lipoprotein-anchoring transpeptidase ErfK/SrfK
MTDFALSNRRSVLFGGASLAALALTGCTSVAQRAPEEPRFSQYYIDMYGPRPDERFPIPAADLRRMNPSYFRTDVADPTGEKPGTIVVSTAERYLYLVQEGGRAIRYGIGVGREGFAWSGRGQIGRKAEWPTWTPPTQMVQRQPELKQYAGGMPPGLGNPLGARAMYIYRDGHDSLYRLHGTPEYWTIGEAVSSGCVRLVNQDVIDLYGRVPVGTKILVA